LRLLAVLVIGFFGLTLIIPSLGAILEGAASRLSGRLGSSFGKGEGFVGALATGFALGIVWSPCAGPILATIAALSATRAVNSQIILVTLMYMLGTGIPLFIFASTGSRVLTKSRVLSPYTHSIQRALGIIMIITALLIYTNYDKVIQAKLLDLFPSYSNFLYKLEQSNQVQEQLSRISGRPSFLPDRGKAPEFLGISQWLNSPTLSIQSLKGKVVLVDFWTYTCINCIRTLPFVTGWYEKYKDQGLVVVGVHTPEFEFEKKTENVQNAIKMFGINYPVAQDNSYSTWNNFNNIYWPAKYLIDKDGRLRYSHFGEGKYEETEMAIQSLLAETGLSMQSGMLTISEETPRIRLTPETYLGHTRMSGFASRERAILGVQDYTLPASIAENNFAYEGEWSFAPEYSESVQNSSLEINFFANKVFLVITPKSPADKVTISLDGVPVDENISGKDVKDGQIIFDTSRLYELIDLRGIPGRHLLRLDFDAEGTQIFAFTFG